jgi:hypothetical protein
VICRPRQFAFLRFAALFGLFLLPAANTAWCEEGPDAVHRAEQFMKRLGSKESRGNPDSLLIEIEQVDLGLRDHLQEYPKDARAAILLMQIYSNRVMIDTFKFLWTGEPGVMNETHPYSEILDRAIEGGSQSADLHYWRGRLYAVHASPPDQDATPNPKLPDAIREMRRAVAINPKDESYRASLAYLVLAGGDQAGARSLYKNLDHGHHPMYLLLHDWERMPVIEGTVLRAEGAMVCSEFLSTFLDFAGGRVRYLVFRGSAAEFERKCRKRWPAFQLAVSDTSGVTHGRGPKMGQHLRWKGEDLEPAIADGKEPEIGQGGIWVEVEERRAQPSDPPGQHPGIRNGEIYCDVEFSNKRKVP